MPLWRGENDFISHNVMLKSLVNSRFQHKSVNLFFMFGNSKG